MWGGGFFDVEFVVGKEKELVGGVMVDFLVGGKASWFWDCGVGERERCWGWNGEMRFSDLFLLWVYDFGGFGVKVVVSKGWGCGWCLVVLCGDD